MADASLATPMAIDDKQILIITISAVFLFLTVLGASLRFYGRLTVLRKLFAEDVFLFFGILAALGLTAISIAGAYYGLGKHYDDLKDSRHLRVVRQAPIIATYFWIGAALLIKTSLLLFYRRLDQRKPMRWTVYCLIFLVIAQNLSLVFVASFSCLPPNALWPKTASAEGRCWNASSIQWYLNANGIIIAFMDSAIFVTPLFMLHHLAIPKNRKYQVGAQFALAILPVVAGCLRCYYIWHITTSSDPFYDLIEPIIWSQAEIHLAILCGSASSFNLLLKGCRNLPCKRQSDSFGSLPTLPGPAMGEHWLSDNKIEHKKWHDWHLPTPELSPTIATALQRSLSSKESVINANSPRDAPRIVLGKRRYTDVAKVPAHLRSASPESVELPASPYFQTIMRVASAPSKEPAYQHQDDASSFTSLSSRQRPVVERSEHSLHFSIDKGFETGSQVSAKAKVRFPSIASKLALDSATYQQAELDAASV